MAKKKKKQKVREEPSLNNYLVESSFSQLWLHDDCGMKAASYTRLVDCPEVRMAIERIADLVSSMTIHLMENQDHGDMRVNNELSRKVDIEPCKNMTRQNWVHWIVKSLLIHGNALVYPKFVTRGEMTLLDDLKPIPWNEAFIDDYTGDTSIHIGNKTYSPDDFLHFVINPKENNPSMGESYQVTLRDVMRNLKQASHTTNEFMSNRVIPNLIVKVDAMTDELSNDEGRGRVYDKFLSASKAGEPWIIPADLIDVQQVKPLTLNDIAIKDTIELSKETVAGIMGIPKFLLGIGDYNKDEYNNFVRTRIMTIAKAIEQELTLKLLISPNWYFRMNARSLFAYDISEVANVYSELYIKGLCTGNEVRDMLGMSPMEELNKLTILENYIPLEKIGDQNKLGGGEDDESKSNETHA